MEYHQRLGDHRPQARVNDVVVTEAARGRVWGGLLLARAEELARKRGCFRMALVTAGWREASISFYVKEGWDDYGEWFVKPLSDDVGPAAATRPRWTTPRRRGARPRAPRPARRPGGGCPRS